MLRSAVVSTESAHRAVLPAKPLLPPHAFSSVSRSAAKYHAGQVCDYGNKLADQGKDSLFAKAKESGSNAEIVANIKGFVGQYNSMLENLRESGTRSGL